MKKNKKGSAAEATLQTPVLSPREENRLMQELREAQRKYQEQIEINQEQQRKLNNQAEAVLEKNKLKVRVRALEKDLQQTVQEHETYMRALIGQHEEEIEQIMKEGRHQQVQEEVKVLKEKLAEKEGIIHFGKELLRKKDMEKEALIAQMNTLVEKGRKKINQFVGNLLKEKNNLLEFSRQQVTIVATKQAQVEELERSKQALQHQVDTLHTKCNSINQKLDWAEQTITEQDAVLDERREEIQKLVEEKKALMMHLQTSIQKEQELKQLQKNISTLEHSLSVQKQMVSEGKNKAQELEKNLKVEHDKVQVLTTDLATHKMTSEAVIEKCSTVYKTVVQENKNHRDKIEELTVALNNTCEEKTSALLRCAALETSQKESEDQLRQATIRIEELQAALDKKKKKKRRWFRFWN